MSFDNLEDYDKELVVRYKFSARNYAKNIGGLLLVRPRVFGSKGDGIVDLKDRKYGVELGAPTLHTDEFHITLPDGFVADELPPPTNAKSTYGGYVSETTLKGNVLSYKREYRVDKVMVPREGLEEFNKFSKQIYADERNAAILKRQ